jgi:predicted lipoprotein with Yx(FWY)xxD motif
VKRSLTTLTMALLLLVAACGGDGEAGSTTTSSAPAQTTTSTTGSPDTTTGPGTTMAPVTDGVSAAQSDLGTILVDPDGFTLYVFTQDTDGESTCYEGCAALWPPVPGDTAISSDLDGSIFGTTSRTDGTEQLTVNGQPLYLYTPDASAGDVNGQGVGGVWFVVGTNGEMIEGPEGAAGGQVPVDDGY